MAGADPASPRSPRGRVIRRRKGTASATGLRRQFWHPERGWHLPFAARVGFAIAMMSLLGAVVLASLSVGQHSELLRRQSASFGQTIARQLAGSLVEPVFTDDFLGIQLQLNQLVAQPLVDGAAVYFPNGQLMAQSGSLGLRFVLDEPAAAGDSAVDTPADRFQSLQLPADHYLADVRFSGANGAYAVVSLDPTPLSLVFASSIRNTILAVLAISLVSLLGAYIASRWLAKPLSRLLSLSEDAREGRVDDLQKGRMRNEWADILDVFAQLGTEVNEKRSVQKLLQRFVDSEVADELLSGNDVLRLEGESVHATVLFVDMVEFTRLSEKMRPADVAKMLNRYLSIFASCARVYRGTVDKFIGDAAMIVFGAPRADEDHALHAMQCADVIRDIARQLNDKRRSLGLAPINLRIGLNSGTMQAGILGSEYRMEYTVVGDAVNVASRLCDTAGAGEILMSETVYDASNRARVVASSAGTIPVKGRARALQVFRLESMREQRSLMVSNLMDDLLSA